MSGQANVNGLNSEDAAIEASAGFGVASKSLQTFASDVARLSKDAVDDTTLLVEKLRAAKSIDEVVSLQTSYVQKSFAKYADYTRRVGELFTALPLEIAKQSQAVLQKSSAAVTQAASQAGQHVQQAAEQVSQHVEHVTEQTSNAIQHAPEQFGQNSSYSDYTNQLNDYQNYDNQNYNNQNYNNQNYNNNDQFHNNQDYVNNNQNYNNDQNYNNRNYSNQNY